MTLTHLAVASDEAISGTILVVDDNDDGREALVELLQMEGFDTLSASDGESALLIIATEQPDLALLDVMLPDMNGLKVLQEIRADPATRELPVILVTVLDQPDDIVYGLELGANDYLVKPIQPEILVARARTQLKLSRLQEQRRADLEHMRQMDAIKDKFLQIAAHDLKNPIGNVLAGVELLSMTDPAITAQIPDFEMIVRVVRNAATLMQSIVSDFLDHDALRSGNLILDRQSVAVNALVEAAIVQFKVAAEKKQITLRAALDPAAGKINADSARLMQVASNLIGNAIKFSQSGSETVIRTRAAGDRVRVEVVDQGPGIVPEEIPQLFMEFARLRNQPTGGEKSSGLGLAIARQLVEMHGGEIGADSAPGQGSTFWFEIPRG